MVKYGPNVHKEIKPEQPKADIQKCECGSELMLFGCRNPRCENYWKNNVKD